MSKKNNEMRRGEDGAVVLTSQLVRLTPLIPMISHNVFRGEFVTTLSYGQYVRCATNFYN